MKNLKAIKIAGRQVGAGHPCFVVMDVALAHNGSLDMAHDFIDVAAEAGVDAVKFQTHIAAAESTLQEPFRVKFSDDKTRYDYWKRTEFTEKQWNGLAKHARDKKLVFLSTPFSVEALELLERLKVPAWKIGSGEPGNTVLIDRMIKTGKPILLSSGMSSWRELNALVKKMKAAKVPVMVYQCTTKYPCPPSLVGLGIIAEMKKRYGVPVGLSDHSGKIYFGIAAAALGAHSVEVHGTMSRDSCGPDVPASLTPSELKQMVEGIRMVEESLRQNPDKTKLAKEMSGMRQIFGRSVVARGAVERGTVLTMEHLTLKKPAIGLAPDKLGDLLGRKARRDMPADTFISFKDVE